MICINNLHLHKNNQPILKGISLKLNEKEVCILYGKNGAGKSSLMKCILGLEKSYQGEITFEKNGVNAQRNSLIFSYLPENESIPGELKISSLIGAFKVASTIKNSLIRDECFDDIYSGLQIQLLENKRFGDLSKGEKKRVLLAIALMQDFSILILDEPFENLDYEMKSIVFDLVRKSMLFSDNPKTVLLSTHQLEPLNNTIEQAVFLVKGSVKEVFRNDETDKNLIVENIKRITKVDIHDSTD